MNVGLGRIFVLSHLTKVQKYPAFCNYPQFPTFSQPFPSHLTSTTVVPVLGYIRIPDWMSMFYGGFRFG